MVMQLIVQKCEPVDISILEECIDINHLGVIPQVLTLPEDYQGLVLRLDEDGLSLHSTAGSPARPTRIDFLSGKLRHRLETSRRSEGLLKAIGMDKYSLPLRVIDATAGLGTDGFVMAAKGCEVLMLEKSGVMAALLADGLRRGRHAGDAVTNEYFQRLSLECGDANDFFGRQAFRESPPDVIYLDPMFPPRRKSAKVKKDMALMQQLLPPNEDVETLVQKAREIAAKRVVLKRPGKASKGTSRKGGLDPDFQVPGKACHFQVFLTM